MLLGAHMSVSGGLSTAFERARSIGINTMQIFTKNQNRWTQKPATSEDVERWFTQRRQSQVEPIVSHAAYLINLATPDDALWQKSVDALTDELERAEQLSLLGVVFHPGAHMGSGEETGIMRIVAGLNRCHGATSGFQTLTLVENTAGQGSALGLHLRATTGHPRRRQRARAGRFLLRHLSRAGRRLRYPHPRDLRRNHGSFRSSAWPRAAALFPFQRQQEGPGLPRGSSRAYRHRRAGPGALWADPQR